MRLIESWFLFKWNRKRSSGKKSKTKLSNTQRTSKSDQHGKRSSLSNAITLTISKIKSYKNQHVGFENWPKMTSKSLETLLSSLLKWCTHGLAVGDLPGEGRNRGVNLPSPYFLSQFLPPPYFWANFSFRPKRLPHIFSLLPTFSPLFLPPPNFFWATFQWAFMQPPSLRLSQICLCNMKKSIFQAVFIFLISSF